MLADLDTMSVEELTNLLRVTEATDAKDVVDGLAADGVGCLPSATRQGTGTRW
jgi:hypothetical protein